MSQIHIAIDPGKHTGICVWDTNERCFRQLTTMGIIGAMNLVKYYHAAYPSCEVVFEDARQRKWFAGKGTEALQGAGSIKRDSSIWEEFLTIENVPFTMLAPARNVTKLNAQQFKELTGYQGRTSEHARDAAGLIMGIIRNGKH